MASATSSGVSAPRSSPTGACRRARVLVSQAESAGGEVGQDLLGALFGTQQPEIGEGTGQQVAEQRHVVRVVVGHHHGDGVGAEGQTGGRLLRARDHDRVGIRKTGGRGQGGTRVHHGDMPAKFPGQAHEWLGVIPGAKNDERDGEG